jgi:predicted O-methyltransferase YrrM
VYARVVVRRYARRARSLATALARSSPSFLWLWLRVERAVPGWTRFEDLRLLYDLAWRGPAEGNVVEIGSAWGKSTIFLARGVQRRGRDGVFAVDHHGGDEKLIAAAMAAHRDPRRRAALGIDADGGYYTRPAFEANILRFEVQDVVTPVIMKSAEAARSVETGPVRLLFIDGDHSYEGVRTDIDLWGPRVVPGGVVVFDDYESPGFGVRQVVDELAVSPEYQPGVMDVRGLFRYLVKR